MVEPSARIRPFKASDDKLARFVIGKASMEGLAAANVKMYTNPLAVSAWIALSCIFVQYMQWWPNAELHGYLGYLQPLPAFACIAVPILALADWLNRPSFEELTQEALRGPDIKDIASYYSSPGSGFWILELGDKFVGLIAIDTSEDASSKFTLFGNSNDGQGDKKHGRMSDTKPVAMIRHFYVDEPYRPTGIAKDLLDHAVNQAFRANDDGKLTSVRAADSPLMSYLSKALNKSGFRRVEGYSRTVGALGWRICMRELSRNEWNKQHSRS